MFKKYLLSILIIFNGFVCSATQQTRDTLAPKEIRSLPANFKQDYSGSDYDYDESTSWITRFLTWLGEWFINWFQVGADSAVNFVYWLRFILIAIVLGIAGYILARLFLRKEGRWIFKKNKEVLDSDLAIQEDIQSVNFKALISSAEAKNDYREAVKFWYYYLLKKLDDKGLVTFDAQSTTYDYQLALEDTTFNKSFSKAAYYYTYIWYGEFAIDAQEYKGTAATFTKILKSVER